MVPKSVLAVSHWRCLDVPVLLTVSIAALVSGLTLPTITFKELVFWKHTFSILTSIQSLYDEKQYFLAGLVGLFSLVFPVIKLCALAAIWCLPLSRGVRLRLVRLLGFLGKWSMLDVFIVAIMIVISRMSGLMDATPRVGIFVFSFSIICTMIVSMRIEHLSRRGLA